jgi:hypothetical protein
VLEGFSAHQQVALDCCKRDDIAKANPPNVRRVIEKEEVIAV